MQSLAIAVRPACMQATTPTLPCMAHGCPCPAPVCLCRLRVGGTSVTRGQMASSRRDGDAGEVARKTAWWSRQSAVQRRPPAREGLMAAVRGPRVDSSSSLPGPARGAFIRNSLPTFLPFELTGPGMQRQWRGV